MVSPVSRPTCTLPRTLLCCSLRSLESVKSCFCCSASIFTFSPVRFSIALSWSFCKLSNPHTSQGNPWGGHRCECALVRTYLEFVRGLVPSEHHLGDGVANPLAALQQRWIVVQHIQLGRRIHELLVPEGRAEKVSTLPTQRS